MQEWKYYVNWAYVLLWPDEFVKVWKSADVTGVVRVHVGGDYFSPGYVDLWKRIVLGRPEIRFYAYTRSWQDGRGNVAREFTRPLRELSELPNMRLVLSCDRETGVPPKDLVPATIRAWLAEDDKDLPPEPVELLFRDHDGMGRETMAVAPRGAGPADGTPVCPVERSKKYVKKTGLITCQNCSWCWSTGHMAYGRRDDDPRLFNAFSAVDLDKHVGRMFGGFWPKTEEGGSKMAGPILGVPATTVQDAEALGCSCGAFSLCGFCGFCVFCLCGC